MRVDPSGDAPEEQPLAFASALRYLLHGAGADFRDAVELGRRFRKGELSRAEFTAAMDQRFSSPDSAS